MELIDMKFDLTGKRALVTGSTQGIGYDIAKALIEHGAQVFVHCSADQDKAVRIAEELGAYAGVTANLADAEQTLALYDKTGPVDISASEISIPVFLPKPSFP